MPVIWPAGEHPRRTIRLAATQKLTSPGGLTVLEPVHPIGPDVEEAVIIRTPMDLHPRERDPFPHAWRLPQKAHFYELDLRVEILVRKQDDPGRRVDQLARLVEERFYADRTLAGRVHALHLVAADVELEGELGKAVGRMIQDWRCIYRFYDA